LFFTQRRIELEVQQAHLIARSQILREQVAFHSQPLERPFALADRVRAGVGWLIAHPQWLVAVVAVPLVLRPARAIGLVARLWAGWRIWRKTTRLIEALS
jgi:hypothetical protein